MSTVKLRESSIPQSFKFRVAEEIEVMGADQQPHAVELSNNYSELDHHQTAVDLFDILFTTSANVIANDIFKDGQDHAILFNDKDGNMLAALVSTYDADTKCYNAGFTYDPEDITSISAENKIPFDKVSITEKLSNKEMSFDDIFDLYAENCHGYVICDHEVIKQFIMIMLEIIRNYLDINAKDTEVEELLIDGPSRYTWGMTKEDYQAAIQPIAIASVEVIKDKKHFSIAFSEEMKAIIKGNEDQI